MRAAILEAPEWLAVRETPEPQPAGGETLIAIELAGICGSDVHTYLGHRVEYFPRIIGHEAIGRVLQPGASGLAGGMRVVIEPNIPCGQCPVCARGQGNVCPRKHIIGGDLPGMLAERVAAPAGFVHPLPETMAPMDAVALEPLAVAVHAFRVGQPAPGDSIGIIGCGSEGLLLLQVAVAMGARVLALDMRESQLAWAERLGAARTHQVQRSDDPEQLGSRIAADWAPTVLFECAGSASAVELALNATAVGGRIVLVGLDTKPARFVSLPFVRRGLSLLSSLIYDHPTDFQRAVELVQSGRVQPSRLVNHVYGLEDAATAMRAAATGDTGKTLVDVAGIAAERSSSFLREGSGMGAP